MENIQLKSGIPSPWIGTGLQPVGNQAMQAGMTTQSVICACAGSRLCTQNHLHSANSSLPTALPPARGARKVGTIGLNDNIKMKLLQITLAYYIERYQRIVKESVIQKNLHIVNYKCCNPFRNLAILLWYTSCLLKWKTKSKASILQV